MFSTLFRGMLANDQGQAVASAIAMAHADFNSMSEKIHIHVVQLLQVGDKWQAIVHVVIEPVLEEKEAKKKEMERRPESQAKKWEKEDFEEIKYYEPKGTERIDILQPDVQTGVPIIAEDLEASVHIYMRSEDASSYYEPSYYRDHPDYHFHFLDKGSLWEASHVIYPDIDLYEGTHADLSDVKPVQEEPNPSPAYNRKHQHELEPYPSYEPKD